MNIPEDIKVAFISQAEKPANIDPLAELVRNWVEPQVRAAYPPLKGSSEIVNQQDWEVVSLMAAQSFSLEAVLMLAVLLTRISFVAPEESVSVMAALSSGWFKGKAARDSGASINWQELAKLPPDQIRSKLNLAGTAHSSGQLERKIPPALVDLFWQQVEVTPGTNNIIEKISNYATAFSPELWQGYNTAMLEHQGTPEAYQEGFLNRRLDIQELRDYPAGTLGYTYYHQIVDNGLDVEILKWNNLGNYANVTEYAAQRILQTHDLWHCLTNYSTDGLEELALQAFQLAQLGSPFSSNLLATILTRDTLVMPENLLYIVPAVCYGWQHGRHNPPFLPVHWEQHWGDTLEQLRRQYHIQPKTVLMG